MTRLAYLALAEYPARIRERILDQAGNDPSVEDVEHYGTLALAEECERRRKRAWVQKELFACVK